MQATCLIVHPAGKTESAAAFPHKVEGVRKDDLRNLKRSCREFFMAFKGWKFSKLSAKYIQKLIRADHLSIGDSRERYRRKLKHMK